MSEATERYAEMVRGPRAAEGGAGDTAHRGALG